MSARTERPRAALVLGAIAAIEAVAIVLLVMTRTPDSERAPTARATSPEMMRAVPAPSFTAPDDRLGSGSGTRPDRSTLPAAGPRPEVAPQPLASARPDTAAVGIVLCGTVAAIDGGELTEAQVGLTLGSDIAESGPVSRGVYAIAGLTPGRWHATCAAPGCLPQRADVDLDPSRAMEHLDFLLERAASIPVRFRTPDGLELLEYLDQAEIPGRLRAIATLEAPPPLPEDLEGVAEWTVFSRHATAEGDSARWKADGWDGVLRLEAPLPVQVSAVWGLKILASEAVAAAGGGVTFTLPLETFLRELSSVRLRVIDADSQQIVDGALAQLDSAYLRVEANGVVAFEKVKPGALTLVIHPPGGWADLPGGGLMLPGASEGAYAETSVALEVQPGQRLDLGDVPLHRTVTVRGHVTDAAGLPIVAGVSASRMDFDVQPEPGAAPLRARMNEKDGSFLIRVVPGRWSFTAGSGSMAGAATTLDVRGDVDDLHLVGVGVPLSK